MGSDHPRAVEARRERLRAKLRERRDITERGCWEYTGSRSSKGRPHMTMGGKTVSVPRVALFAFRGTELGPDDMALHHCDNELCFNPDHLYVGTIADNLRDMVRRGRAWWMR